MKASHVWLAVFLSSMVGILTPITASMLGIDPESRLAQLLIALAEGFAALSLAWPIARLFGMTPMMTLAGPCPNCKTRPSGWWGSKPESNRLRLICGKCGTDVDLWLRRPTSQPAVAARPTYRLRWPEFLGMWRRIA